MQSEAMLRSGADDVGRRQIMEHMRAGDDAERSDEEERH
jgi:hypothetical protein